MHERKSICSVLVLALPVHATFYPFYMHYLLISFLSFIILFAKCKKWLGLFADTSKLEHCEVLLIEIRCRVASQRDDK